MACSSRTPALRHLMTSQAPPLRASNQRRWAAVHDVRFLATTQPRRSVIEKYREKLDAKARREGLAGIDQLKAAYADRIQDVRRRDAPTAFPSPGGGAAIPAGSPGVSTTGAAAASNAPSSPQPARSAFPKAAGTPKGAKPLSSILDLPKALALPETELSAVWRLRHASDPHSLAAVVPAATYARMERLARTHPQFVLPVPHPEQGAEMHFLQWTFDAATASATVLFARLAEYKLRGEWAAPHTSVTHYSELANTKGVVLMRGQTVEGAGVSVDEARWLVMSLQRFYGATEGEERGGERRKLLEWFGAGDERFNVERLMEEAERFG